MKPSSPKPGTTVGQIFPCSPYVAMANHVQALNAVYTPREVDPNVVCDGVAIVKIDGELCNGASWWFDSYDSIFERFSDAIMSEEVRTVVLQICSPGGDAEGLNACVDAMLRVKRKARKPVLCHTIGAYSAAYAMACVADEIYVDRSGGVGSIGVIAAMQSIAGALKKAGVDVRVKTTGKRKSDGNPYVAITPQAEAHVQRHIDFLGGIYFQLVSDARGLEVEAIKALEADTFYARGAVKKGLADDVMSVDAVVKYALKLAASL